MADVMAHKDETTQYLMWDKCLNDLLDEVKVEIKNTAQKR